MCPHPVLSWSRNLFCWLSNTFLQHGRLGCQAMAKKYLHKLIPGFTYHTGRNLELSKAAYPDNRWFRVSHNWFENRQLLLN
jgi:hypothetical protein